MTSEASPPPPSVNLRAPDPGDGGLPRLQFWTVDRVGPTTGPAVRHGNVELFEAVASSDEVVVLAKLSLTSVVAAAEMLASIAAYVKTKPTKSAVPRNVRS